MSQRVTCSHATTAGSFVASAARSSDPALSTPRPDPPKASGRLSAFSRFPGGRGRAGGSRLANSDDGATVPVQELRREQAVVRLAEELHRRRAIVRVRRRAEAQVQML